MKKTKNFLIGSSIALAMLTPTIMVMDNKNSTDNNVEFLSVPETKVEQTIPINEFHFSSEQHSETYNINGVHTLTTGSRTLGMADYEIKISSELDEDFGISIPEITITNLNTGLTEPSLERMIFIPPAIIDKGDKAIYSYISSFRSGLEKSTYEQEWLTQNYDGEKGIYFALNAESQYDYTTIVEPIIFHITWSEDFNNGSYIGKRTIYYDNLDNNSTTLTYKTKKVGADTLGINTNTVDKVEYESMWTFSDVKIKDPVTKADSTYRIVSENDYFRAYNFVGQFNAISNKVTLADIDLSSKSIDAYMDRFEDNYFYPDIPEFKIYDAIEVSESDLGFDWNDAADINANYYALDTIFDDLMSERDSAYNNEFHENIVMNSIDTIREYNGKYYLIEEIAFIPFDNDKYIAREQIDEIINKVDDGVFEEWIKNLTLMFSSDSYYYDYTAGTYGRQYSNKSLIYLEIEDSANFISSTETTLLIFATLSLVGLAVVLVFLVRSSMKEDEGVEVIGGGN